MAKTLVTGYAASVQVGLDSFAQFRQGAGEGRQAFELAFRGIATPAVVVAVLFAAFHVPARGLDVPRGARADTDIGPGRRDGEGADAVQHLVVADEPPPRIVVDEALARCRALKT